MADNREEDQTNYQGKIESLFSDEREKPVEEGEINFDELDKYLAYLERTDPSSVSQNHGLSADNSGSKSKNKHELGNSSKKPMNNNNKKRKSKMTKMTTIDREELGSQTRTIVIDGDVDPIQKCGLCGRTFMNRRALGSHSKFHKNEAKRRGLRYNKLERRSMINIA